MNDFKNEFETNDDNQEIVKPNNVSDTGDTEELHTASIEMSETPILQENIPSQAEAKIEVNNTVPSDYAPQQNINAEQKSSTAYTYSGSQLGNNARETFESYRNANQSTNSNASQNTGAYQSVPYTNKAYETGYRQANSANSTTNQTGYNVPYNEHINKKKDSKKGSRLVAAMLAAAVLNLAVLGGAFALGQKYGAKNGGEMTRTSLSQSIKMNEGEQNPSSTSGTTNTASTTGDMDTTEVAKQVGPAVVGIKSAVQGQASLFGGYSTSEAQGSGIILSNDGYIVTNNHVVDGASTVTVQLNTGSEYEAKVIGLDDQTDLAVIKIEATEELTVAKLGDSSKVEVGETAIAIGNPMGLEFFGSVTQGIISAVNRTVEIDNRTMNLIQTDAAINSGNSGGALVNSKGEVIGINAVKVSTSGVEGMGFAIPISEAKPIVSDLLDFGYVKGRPVIGISTRDVSSYMAQQYGWPEGVQIMSVNTENAKKAGLQQGDIITKIDGKEITKGADLTSYKDTKSPGDEIEIVVYKYATGNQETVKVVLSEQLPD